MATELISVPIPRYLETFENILWCIYSPSASQHIMEVIAAPWLVAATSVMFVFRV